MESYRSTTDPCAGNGGGFQTPDMRQQGSVHYSTPSPSSVQSFSGQMQEVVRAGMIQVPPARAGSPSLHHVDAARRRFVVRPTAESLHAAAVHTGQMPFCTQVGGGHGMPSLHMFPGAGGYGIAPHVYPAQHTVERGGVMRDEWQWSPQCRQPSQPMHGGLCAPSPMSVPRSAAEASPSLAEVQREDMDEGWPVHSRAPSPAGLQGPSFGGEEDDFVGDDEVEDDALMADADGQHRFKRSKDRYEWVHDQMAELGFPHCSAEDCCRKWQGMMAAAKLILDKCENALGKPSYWDMNHEERKAEQVPLGFEKALWEVMEWKLNRPSIKCDNTLASENLPANAGGNSSSGGPAQPSLKSRLWRNLLGAWNKVAPMKVIPPTTKQEVLNQSLFDNPLITTVGGSPFSAAEISGGFGKSWIKKGVLQLNDIWDQEAGTFLEVPSLRMKLPRLHNVTQHYVDLMAFIPSSWIRLIQVDADHAAGTWLRAEDSAHRFYYLQGLDLVSCMTAQSWCLPVTAESKGKLRLETEDYLVNDVSHLEEVRVHTQSTAHGKKVMTLLGGANQLRVEPLLLGWEDGSAFNRLDCYRPKIGVYTQQARLKKTPSSLALGRAESHQLEGVLEQGLHKLWKALMKVSVQKQASLMWLQSLLVTATAMWPATKGMEISTQCRRCNWGWENMIHIWLYCPLVDELLMW
ncbi:hypothetical protein CBR_g58776 [Chara braunii]|uniref:Uncharacterized protein n=1 Tax=Chara braunii TaxID=69332 RepID=A0A388MEW3_CHABU|nr:hypothetical protein CBR_g58776 [Chara braunii]|eukprot:GBG93091.1 hypothetical protein CBR_g58776 [Chara braunii]